ncbi:hypothetical protein [Streptomyces monomycini]|uniref:hypothetical protein n=1 Tax=Streptomyces monomycini TaxID=371720 RepID=UPI0004AA06ED|nr:hypothetical protein [Streptomyces monomycini]
MIEAIVLDGFLEEETVPGDLHGSTVRFRLTVSPTDERTDEMTLPCAVTDPVMAAAVLHDLLPGDKLRVTGHLRLPRAPHEPMSLAVTALEVLATAPVLTDSAGAFTTVLDRYGPYVCYVDADTDQVPVWTETGVWVGCADSPGDVSGLLERFEQRQAADGE